jgi:hypothetical protein
MDILSNISKAIIEPRIYTVLVKSTKGQALHMGVYFSLEEAYSAAVREIPGYKNGDRADMDLWDSLPARDVIVSILNPIKIEAIENENPLLNEIKKLLPMDGEEIHIVEKENLPKEIKELIDIKPMDVNDYIQSMEHSKNILMGKLIESGDVSKANEIKQLIGNISHKYIIKEIEKRNKK